MGKMGELYIETMNETDGLEINNLINLTYSKNITLTNLNCVSSVSRIDVLEQTTKETEGLEDYQLFELIAQKNLKISSMKK